MPDLKGHDLRRDARSESARLQSCRKILGRARLSAAPSDPPHSSWPLARAPSPLIKCQASIYCANLCPRKCGAKFNDKLFFTTSNGMTYHKSIGTRYTAKNSNLLL